MNNQIRLPHAGLGFVHLKTMALASISAPTQQSRASKRTIIIVDDDRDTADMLALALSLEGYQAHEAYNAASALLLANEICPDVIITDIGMPEMSGIELAKGLRLTLGDKVRLIALTGHAAKTIRIESREAGFDYYVLKPISCEDLIPYIEAETFETE